MKARTAAQMAARRRRQAGHTLIELIVASAIGLMVMGAMTSIVLTMALGANTATSRIEASAQIRNFQLTAYDDFALSQPPLPTGCGTPASPCTTQDMILKGSQMPNPLSSSPPQYMVRYTWDPARSLVTRYVNAGSRVVASSVTGYSWYIDGSGGHPAVVVSMNVTVGFYNTTYTESQTLLFYPRVASR
jgi:type II secretory pathway pseudopilin PulG